MRNTAFIVLLLAFAPAAVVAAICITRHWRYRTQQISLRDFGRGASPHYQYVPTSPYDSAKSQKVLILSAEKKPLALV